MRSLLVGSALLPLLFVTTLAHAADPPAAPPAKDPPVPAKEQPAAAATTPAAPTKREPSAGDFATARAALREGLQHREKGELPQALMRLSSAYDLVPTPVTGFELGKTHMMLGHVLQAHELFKKVVRMPASMEESTRSQSARDEAARLAKEVEPRIPTLKIKLTLPKEATAVVKIDDDVITTPSAETTRSVDPGPHDIVAKAGDGPEQKVHVEVAESESKEVALAPQWIKPKDPPPSSNQPEAIFVKSTNPLVYIGFGVAGAAAVVTGITAFVAFNAHRDARRRCGDSFCPPKSDTGGIGGSGASIGDLNFTEQSNQAAGWTLVAVVAGITTVLFTGVGILGIRRPVKERVITLNAPPPPSKPTIQPVVGMGNVGVVGTF
jgi:hypothetical protein